MTNTQQGKNVILTVLIVAAVLAGGIGFYAVYERGKPVPTSQDRETETQTQQQVTPTPIAETPKDTTAGWATYTNTKYGFSLKHPSNLPAGTVSSNSALGTFDSPVKGFHVGPLVFIALKDTTLKQEATNYFEATYQAAVNPPVAETPEGPTISCKIDKIANTLVRSVSCVGEGGPARYAYIRGTEYDIFVDGYSKGFDGADHGEFKSETDYEQILASFKF